MLHFHYVVIGNSDIEVKFKMFSFSCYPIPLMNFCDRHSKDQ